MAKQIFYEKFNEKCEEFMKDLIALFSQIEQFKYLRSGFNVVKNLDYKTPQKIFNSYISTTFKEQILNKDEDFFLTKTDYNIRNSSSYKKEYWDEFIEYIRTIWKTLDNDNKDIIWKYFHILVVLNDKCQE